MAGRAWRFHDVTDDVRERAALRQPAAPAPASNDRRRDVDNAARIGPGGVAAFHLDPQAEDVHAQATRLLNEATGATPDASIAESCLQPVSLQTHMKCAREFREFLRPDSLPTHPCGVCQKYTAAKELHDLELSSPLLALLRVSTQPGLPRSGGHTTISFGGAAYHLEPAALRPPPGDEHGNVNGAAAPLLRVCGVCLGALSCGEVPKDSLANVDPGLLNDPELPPLRMLEELILSAFRVSRGHVLKLFVGRDHRNHRKSFQGHVFAYPQGSVAEALQATNWPLRPELIPEFLHVVLVGPVGSIDEARRLAKEATHVLSVRGWVIVRYALRLERLGYGRCNPAVLAQYALKIEIFFFFGVDRALTER